MSSIQVGIVMGSDSDLPIMEKCGDALSEFGVGYEMLVSSAHRHPEKTARYARGAADAGLKVIIAAAGGAAHLPGVIASMTTLPVIGVPIAIEPLQGIDSLYSIVQMPRGIPVATVTINGAYNAGLLAVEMLAMEEEELREKLNSYRQKLAAQVEEKDSRLREKLKSCQQLEQGEKE
ncbi:MAG: N5-carboxyaminoimidazole ribonucleotide mutase [Firmicutes bacterium ML8_F2]|jgi:5-(carboxyamino)imidazole ribonucleotide mutase|nr:MAG: N5-carboxyaminoimidazole ribonucleotide mutase [Firmicutes bacterium ML8_F2]